MTDLIVAVLVAAITGLTILWYKHRSAYQRILPFLTMVLVASALVQVGYLLGWNDGFKEGTAWLRDHQSYLESDPKPANEPTPNSPEPFRIFLLCGLAAYFLLLPQLGELIDSEGSAGADTDENSE